MTSRSRLMCGSHKQEKSTLSLTVKNAKMGRLDVRVVAARNLADTQWVSKPDPYCIVRVENQKHKTTVKENNLNPEWNEVFKFVVSDHQSAQVVVEVWNKNVVSDELMGSYSLSLSSLIRGVVRDEWFLLQRSKSNAEIRLRLLAHDFGQSSSDGQMLVTSTSVSGVSALPQSFPSPQAYPSPYQSTGGQDPAQKPQSGAAGYPQPQGTTTTSAVYRAPVNPMPMYGPPQPSYGSSAAATPYSPFNQPPPAVQRPVYGLPQHQPVAYGQPPYNPQPYGAPQPAPYAYPPQGSAASGYYPPPSAVAVQSSGYYPPPSGALQPAAQGPVIGVPLGFSGQQPSPYPQAQTPYQSYPPPPQSYGGACRPA